MRATARYHAFSTLLQVSAVDALTIVRKNWPEFVPECDPALLAST
jgi:hypothetical protein